MQRFQLETFRSEVARSETIAHLRTIRDRAHETLHGYPLLLDGIAWNALMNDVHDAIVARVVALTERKLQKGGLAMPEAAPYAFLLFGSGGRREQTLWSDQDNGLVYADPEDGQETEAERYYEQFGGALVEGLEEAGYPRCEGDVVCTNPAWRKPLSAWIGTLRSWLTEPDWEHMRYLLIVADMRCFAGDDKLAAAIRAYLLAYVNEHRDILEHLLHNTLHRKVSLGPFGQLIRERYGEDAGGVDIKYGSYIPLVNAIRLLAMAHGIGATSTVGRIEALGAACPDRAEEMRAWEKALEINLRLRSLTPFQLEDGRYTSRGKLAATDLTKERKHDLKLCLKIGTQLQRYVNTHIREAIEKGE
ncbi:DUF294 nucleotidyltransferase-like domain-containing protein [Paenibacillus cymbidii]|uniref:DUF294 nucleotidyltransferase-like domain-containing protein n=1 Tax=Paenibacillus cymbidii TaxID=1639034 RepID=UPI001082206C|nr:DUF294 nucleotidyltransferase-like domain-containing protein [Paenibacillus cymbidii]